MSEQPTYYLYVIDYWVPFPTSEYGGLVLVTAPSDEDVIQLLSGRQWDYIGCDEMDQALVEAVHDAARYELKGSYKTEIVKEFIT
jgi:hypothetical protein